MNATAEAATFEAAHPGWHVSWHEAGTWYARRAGERHHAPFGHPAAWLAVNGARNVTVCAPTLEDLDAAIEAAPPERHWMYRANCCARSWG